jgi:hypothetical protein
MCNSQNASAYKEDKSYAVASTAFPPSPALPTRGGEFPEPSQQQKKPCVGGKKPTMAARVTPLPLWEGLGEGGK